MNRFRIIGIRILQDCDKRICKILKVNTTYFICKGYKVSQNNDHLIERCEQSLEKSGYHENSIYDVKGFGETPRTSRIVNISVSAIVGKNGDGKSTIVEIMMRILYILTKKQKEIDKGLNAILYFEMGQEIFSIVCKNKKIEVRKNGIVIEKLQEEIQKFYTLIFNYSLYAYNSTTNNSSNSTFTNMVMDLYQDGELEGKAIHLHPSRDINGSVNIRDLLQLTNTRLLAIYTQSKKAREIDNSNLAIGFAYKVRLDTRVLADLIGCLAKIVSDSNHQNELKRKYKLFTIDHFSRFSIGYPSNLTKTNRLDSFFHDANNLLESNKDIIKFVKSLNVTMDESLKDQFIRLSNYYNEPLSGSNTEKSFDIELLLLFIFLNKVWEYAINDHLKYRLKLNNILKKCQKTDTKIEAKESTALFVFARLSLENSILQFFMDMLNLVSIKKIIYTEPNKISSIFNPLKETIIDLIDNGVKEDKHDFTLCVNYLKKNDDSFFIENKKFDKYDHFISFEKLYEKIKGINTEISLNKIVNNMPSSRVFEGEIIFRKKSQIGNTKDYFGSSEMSSGELQLLSTISSIVYYIRSIDKDVRWENCSQYRHINLILEEIELYYHPEYQRIFLDTLLRNIRNIELERIESINIIFVTHSPFILSDISQKNILFLKDGKDCGNEITVNPFAANVNEILSQSFFLDNGFMGELAKTKIQSLITFLKDLKRKGDNYWNKPTSLSFIEQIGEPLLFHNLMDLYTKKYYGDRNELIQWHVKQIKRLRKHNKK